MIALLLFAAAAAQPSSNFAGACNQLAKTDAEHAFCAAGERDAKLQDPLETACLDANQAQQGMNQCEGEAYERADKALNAQWAKVMAGDGEKEEAQLLLDSQRAWLKYREANCLAGAYSSKGGSIYPMLVSGCMAELTRQRTQQLVEMLEGEGN
jgi:uncharacterized protein YecT (DUF1311 family)